MAIELIDGTIVPDVPEEILATHPYVVITHAIDINNSNPSNGVMIYKYLLHATTAPIRYGFMKVESSDSSLTMNMLIAESTAYLEYEVDTKTNTWVAVSENKMGIVDEDEGLIAIILNEALSDVMAFSIVSLRWANHDVYYAELDENASSIKNGIIVLDTKFNFDIELVNYNGTYLPLFPKWMDIQFL